MRLAIQGLKVCITAAVLQYCQPRRWMVSRLFLCPGPVAPFPAPQALRPTTQRLYYSLRIYNFHGFKRSINWVVSRISLLIAHFTKVTNTSNNSTDISWKFYSWGKKYKPKPYSICILLQNLSILQVQNIFSNPYFCENSLLYNLLRRWKKTNL